MLENVTLVTLFQQQYFLLELGLLLYTWYSYEKDLPWYIKSDLNKFFANTLLFYLVPDKLPHTLVVSFRADFLLQQVVKVHKERLVPDVLLASIT